jgi:predicted nucleic acid-binding protein
LDTNVLSEPAHPKPDPAVLRWLAVQDSAQLFTTSINEAEILFGVARMPRGIRRATVEAAMRNLFEKEFDGRVLPFDRPAAALFAEIVAARMQMGKPIGTMDAQIAAIAHSRGAAVATRDVTDFRGCGIEVIDPWTTKD